MNGMLPTFIVAAGLTAILIAQSPDPQQLWRHRNIGKALFETPTALSQAPAELKKAVDLAPDSFRDRLNYGIALLRAGDLDNAIAQLERAQKQDPSVPHTWFNLGIAYKRHRRYADAVRQFEHMVALTPDEPVAHYNLGLLYKLLDRGSEAMREFERAANLDPHMVAPRFQIYTHYRLENNEAAAARALESFEDAKQKQQAADETEDVEWCFYAELYDPLRARPRVRDASPAPAWNFERRKLAGAADPSTAGLLVLDADGDGRPDLLVWSRKGIAIYRNGSDLIPETGLARETRVAGVAAGDYDNDGLADLCVLTEDGARLYRNMGGRFEKLPVALPPGQYDAAVWLDYDHDYDLDLFLLGSKSVLLRNEGASKFHDYSLHFPFVTGRALSGAAIRVIPDTKSIDLAVTYADRNAVLYRDQLRGVFEAAPLDAIPPRSRDLKVIDFDNDGWLDLAIVSPDGVSQVRNRNGHFVADRLRPPNRMPDAIAWATADFNGDGLPDTAAVTRDGSIQMLLNRTTTAHQWITVVLSGVKNLKLAAGTEVEIKAGDHYQKQVYGGIPLLFDLAAHKNVDVIRITWPNGTIQNQVDQPAGRAVSIKEAPRLAGSCPMIFTWNGSGFEFITDVLGVAPLGASSGDANYFPVDHDEYVSIPGEALAAREGQYDVRITEELHEISYLDQVRLIALDHPAGIDVFTNEKFKSPPFPEFRLYGVRKRIRPMAAYDDAGRNLLPALLARDGIYAAGFDHDSGGVAGLHALTLDFSKDAAPDNGAVLLLNGWVDWADGSTFMRAAQGGGAGLVLPYLQVKDADGKWRTIIEDMGIPAGKPKIIAVDLTGKFLSASREVRIVTNLCVYWDEIFLSEDTAAPKVRLTPLDAIDANLHLRGFSRAVIDPRREQPEWFRYSNPTTAAPWNQIPGFYTRYGDVRELVRDIDDKLIIMGAGDELSLRFDGRNLPQLPAGWRRDFLLFVDGWAKDADANTAFSQTVEPLPFHGMSRYPYAASERFPNDVEHELWRRQYNTRPAIRFVQPLAATGRRSMNQRLR